MLVFFGQISSQPPKKLILAQQPPWVLEEMYGFRDFHRKWAFLSEADCQMCATWSSGSRQVVCFFRGKTSCTQEHSTSEVVCSSVWAWHPSGVPLTIVVLDLAGDQQPCAHHCLQPGICGVQFGEMGFQPTDYRKCDKTCGEMKTFILKHVHHTYEKDKMKQLASYLKYFKQKLLFHHQPELCKADLVFPLMMHASQFQTSHDFKLEWGEWTPNI